jgi:hypothetical protein
MTDEQTETQAEEQDLEHSPIESPGASIRLIRSGAPTDETFAIASSAVVGRFDPDVGPIEIDLGSLPEGSYISRRHARIWEDAGKWFLQDLGSSNGTFVLASTGDFERISDQVELTNGTQVCFGNARFSFECSQQPVTAVVESSIVEEEPVASEDTD